MIKVPNDDIMKAICPLPWVSLSMNTDSSLRVCCNTNHGGFVLHNGRKTFLSSVGKIADIAALDTYKSLKADMLAGRRPDFCNSCYRTEDAGGISTRQYYVNQFNFELNNILSSDQPENETQLKFIDFSLSNNCNLKCRMCGPGSSFLLKNDFNELGLRYDVDYANRAHNAWAFTGAVKELIQTESKNITNLLFTGGEPLINQVHLNILELLVEQGAACNIALTYHSNLMILNEQILELWKNFKSVNLHLSLEAHEKYNDYIRFGSKWDKIIENLHRLFEYKKNNSMWIEIHTVFQAYNFTLIPSYLEKLKEFSEHIPVFPHFIWIDQPHFLSVNILPIEIKESAIKNIESYLAKNQTYYENTKYSEFNLGKVKILKSYLNRVEKFNNEKHLQEFINYTNKFDFHRNQKITDIVPDYTNLFT